jgi:hypothetical protein
VKYGIVEEMGSRNFYKAINRTTHRVDSRFPDFLGRSSKKIVGSKVLVDEYLHGDS